MATPRATAERYRLVTRPGEVWIHIDHFRKKSRRVWAVQTLVRGRPTYRVASKVEIHATVRTRYHQVGRGGLQPVAYLVAAPAVAIWVSPNVCVVQRFRRR